MKISKMNVAVVLTMLLCCFGAQVASAQEPAPNEVILYEARDYIGDSVSIKLPSGVRSWSTEVAQKLYGKVSSIRIGSNVKVRLFRDFNFHEGKPYKQYRQVTL